MCRPLLVRSFMEVQAVWRGHKIRARANAAKLETQKDQQVAAFVSYSARRGQLSHGNQNMESCGERSAEAPVKIQAAYRAYYVRNLLTVADCGLRRKQERAAVELQAVYRRHRARRAVVTTVASQENGRYRSAMEVETGCDENGDRTSLTRVEGGLRTPRQHRATIVIQLWYRRHLATKTPASVNDVHTKRQQHPANVSMRGWYRGRTLRCSSTGALHLDKAISGPKVMLTDSIGVHAKGVVAATPEDVAENAKDIIQKGGKQRALEGFFWQDGAVSSLAYDSDDEERGRVREGENKSRGERLEETQLQLALQRLTHSILSNNSDPSCVLGTNAIKQTLTLDQDDPRLKRALQKSLYGVESLMGQGSGEGKVANTRKLLDSIIVTEGEDARLKLIGALKTLEVSLSSGVAPSVVHSGNDE